MRNLRDEIKELAIDAAFSECRLLVDELKELKVNLSLELQATRDQRLAEAREWRELAEAMRELITTVKANERINRTVLDIIDSAKTGETQWENQPKAKRRNRRSSNPSSTLGQFAKSTG